MGRRRQPRLRAEGGNHVSEWFGYRVYPQISRRKAGLEHQRKGICPFLTSACGTTKPCVKAAASMGVCTISSCSNGPRQDWLVCPYRALGSPIMEDAAARLFGSPSGAQPLVVPAPMLEKKESRRAVMEAASSGELALVYLQDKLGGEISVPRTDYSPEVSFDITLVEILRDGEGFDIGRYGVLEVQTMDFHGSYRHAVQNLTDALRLHGPRFHGALKENPSWLSDKIEGPNIANVFKRTFYQMMLKFQIATQSPSAGCVLAIPSAVWDSWQRHLARPSLGMDGDVRVLGRPASPARPDGRAAWIYVFDIVAGASPSPNPIEMTMVVRTDADAISDLALKTAPERALIEGGLMAALPARIRQRIAKWWPELRS